MLELIVGATVGCVAAGAGAGVLWKRLQIATAQLGALAKQAEDARAECRVKEDLLSSLEEETNWLRQQMDGRCQTTRRVYRILTVGISGTGKTALTLKWANPLFNLGDLRGSKIERYEKTVSQVMHKEVLTEHVFAVDDWGGEHIVDALQQAMTEEIHGLLIVVDLACSAPRTGADAEEPIGADPERIQRQLREFQPEVLKFFFGPKAMASCKTVVLFVNKSDVIAGTPAQIERAARGHYQKLISDLEAYSERIDVRVLVGSATSGHSTHHLFSHFVHRILPPSAYDAQLLQRMMMESAPENAHVDSQ